MKNLPINLVCCLLLVFYTADCKAQFQKELKFIHQKKQAGKVIHGLQVTLAVDTVQKESPKGLRFLVKIKNDSTSNIVIGNPLDFITVSLENENNFDVYIRDIPYYLNDTKGPGLPKRNFHAFELESALVNGQKLKEDLMTADTTNLPAKSTIEILYNVKRTLKAIPVAPYTRDQEISIKPGKYRLYIIVSVVDADFRKSADHKPNSETFHLPQIPISYGN